MRVSGRERVDVAIVGAGLAGTLSAIALARRGCRVVLVDLHAAPQPEFRAEQLVGSLTDRLHDLGALESMTGGRPPCPVTLDTRAGRVVGRTRVPQFGVPYHEMVAGARAALPAEVDLRYGRIGALEDGPGRQVLAMADGSRIEARLAVLATGLATVLPKRLGFTYRTLRRNHSLTLGFDIEAPGFMPIAKPFVQHPTSVRQRVDYLAVFPMAGRLRANLFCYNDSASDWVRAFCRAPDAALASCMPGLDKILGPYRIASAVQTRTNDLRVAADPVRDGVVLVGDVFQTPCPAAGTGIDRLLSDVSALARHVPIWLSSPGMSADKVASFYADAEKRAVDAESLRIAEYRRAVSTEPGLRWTFHRTHVVLRQRLRGVMKEAVEALRPGAIPKRQAAASP